MNKVNPKPFKWKRFVRHAKRKLRKFLAFLVFLLEFLLIQMAVFSSILVTIFFFYQSFIFFVISVFCFALLYVSHFAIFIIYKDTVNHLISENPKDEEQEPHEELIEEDNDPNAPLHTRCTKSITKCCSSMSRGLTSCVQSATKNIWNVLRKILFCLFSILLLDLPVWFYQVRFKNQDEETKNYQNILALIVGWASIFSFIPILFLSCLWMINNPHYNPIFGLETQLLHLIMNIGLAFIVIGAVIGLYHMQFFKKHCKAYDSFFWGFIKTQELVAKVLLISYIVKYSQFQLIPLAIVSSTYFIYVLTSTLLFTCWSQYQDKKIIGFIKSFLLNTYARVLFLPYKETPCLQQSLTCYDDVVIKSEDKKKHDHTVKQLIIPEGWDNLMILSDINKKGVGLTRRAYTHIVHSLRFIENLNLIIFCIALSIRHGNLIEYVEPEKASLYYLGRPCSVVFTFIPLIYYVSAGIRTIHYSQHDISGIDE